MLRQRPVFSSCLVATGHLFLASVLAVASAGAVALAADLPESGGGRVVVIFEPGTDPVSAYRTVVTAGGIPLRGGLADNVMLVEGPEDGFAGRLRNAGAWLVVDASSFPGCGNEPAKSRDRI
ncbi:MAG: hypothetical protein ACMVY4_01900 [Minwuia sp.]|uniref:hypothetical protein n=1 Tax=Minwuia sp. TaxID=2493630 RepID=UPI003A83B428